MGSERATEIQAEVIRDRNYVWDCFDQGRWAHASGVKREANPHGPLYPGYFHSNMAEWLRGWDAEASRAAA